MNKKYIFTGAIVSLLLMTVACSTSRQVTIKIERKKPLEPARTTTLVAGVSKVDITPPPGMPLAGYSSLGSRATGFRHRLYARTVYLKGKDDSGVALLQCDLLFGSLMLHHRVAELIAAKTDVDVTGLMISGTHTHSAPGNYYASKFYNRFASCSAGFDEKFFNFLSERMAESVIAAYENRRPAKTGAGSVEIKGAAWNRSLPAYMKNFTDMQDGEIDPGKAVNHTLNMVRIDCLDPDGKYRPVGALTSFSLHGTVISSKNELYNGDVFAYTERQVEWSITRTYGTEEPVCALMNGTHADNSPAYNRDARGFAEAKRLGKSIGQKAFTLFQQLGKKLSADVSVRAWAKEVDVYRKPGIDDIELCTRPVVGSSLTVGSTEDGSTPVLKWLPFFREGWGSSRWIFTGGCHGHKRYAGGPMQMLILPRDDFPHVMFFQVIQVGSLYLLPLPFEVTFEAGNRIEKACADASGTRDGRFAVISCANGMFGYATTPAEYSAQHYEGGHTLFGPSTVPFLTAHVRRMVSPKGEPPPVLQKRWEFVQEGTDFMPKEKAYSGKRMEKESPVMVENEDPGKRAVSFTWVDLPPAAMEFHRPLVYIETSIDGNNWSSLKTNGIPVDDDCGDISVECINDEVDNGMALYQTVWYDAELAGDRLYRFVIRPRGDQEKLVSSIFRLRNKD